jgi:hypothetical protein
LQTLLTTDRVKDLLVERKNLRFLKQAASLSSHSMLRMLQEMNRLRTSVKMTVTAKSSAVFHWKSSISSIIITDLFMQLLGF